MPEDSLTAELSRLRSDLEAANRRLAEAYRLASLGRLVAGIAHEISTPVGAILSNNAVVLRSLDRLRQALSAPDLAEAAQIVEVLSSLAAVDKIACERIAGVVPGLKTFAREQEAALAQADLNELLRTTLALTHSEFRSRITLETDFRELPNVLCYPQLLAQAFLNLLVNAGQAIPGQGRVRVRTRLEGDRVHISISDTGSGIHPEDRSKVFSRGFTTKPVGVGTGLGLALVRQVVVDRHHGSIDFESEPGVGTTFHIRLPLTQPATGV